MDLSKPVTGPAERIILHVDMDAFFAAVEMREHPDIRGRPVIVGADPKEGKGRGVVSTASYEARIFGVHSAMPISKAFERCPGGVFVRPHFDLYTRASEDVMEIAKSVSGQFEQVSIDEAYLDISSAGDYVTARATASALKAAIRNKTGLSCSIGVGPSKVVAKIASDYRKPDGLTVVEPGMVSEFLSPLPIEKIPGVGRKSSETLHRMGIRTIGDLASIDVQELIALFGKWGAVIHDLASGTDNREVRQEEGYRSISREITFEHDTDDDQVLVQTLDLMAGELCAVLKNEQLRFRTITVKLRDEHFHTRTRSKTNERYSDDPSLIKETSYRLLGEFLEGSKIRLIGLRLSGFEPKGTRQTTISEFNG
jgi:DNA polymerase IV (archaeal DinB-like DNA polymerase)